ncbi:PhoH family protein, partial [Escherichia coli]|nr:PhoH family protein [Escherichia coli]
MCGPFDDNIKHLERRLGVEINHRSDHFTIVGKPHTSAAALDILKTLYVDTAPVRGEIPDIEPEQIHLAIKESGVLEQNTESSIAHGKEVFV